MQSYGGFWEETIFLPTFVWVCHDSSAFLRQTTGNSPILVASAEFPDSCLYWNKLWQVPGSSVTRWKLTGRFFGSLRLGQIIWDNEAGREFCHARVRRICDCHRISWPRCDTQITLTTVSLKKPKGYDDKYDFYGIRRIDPQIGIRCYL